MAKIWFFIGLFLLIAYEIFNVYFIMPMPGSQKMNSIDVAYFLYTWRWVFRILFSVMILYGLFMAKWKLRWLPLALVCLLAVCIYMLNFKLAADHMFYKPRNVLM